MAADDVTPVGQLAGEFGPNVGLVEEIYRQWLEDPSSVAESWQDFFADYTPRLPADRGPAGRGGNGGGVPADAAAAPAPTVNAPAPAPTAPAPAPTAPAPAPT